MRSLIENAVVKYRVSCKLNKMGDNLVIWIPKDQQQKLRKLLKKPLIVTIEPLEDLDEDNGGGSKK